MLLALKFWWDSGSSSTVDFAAVVDGSSSVGIDLSTEQQLAATITGSTRVTAAYLILNEVAPGDWPLPERKETPRIVLPHRTTRVSLSTVIRLAPARAIVGGVTRLNFGAVIKSAIGATPQWQTFDLTQPLTMLATSATVLQAQVVLKQSMACVDRGRSDVQFQLRMTDDDLEDAMLVLLALEAA